jgi:hypothetical protein
MLLQIIEKSRHGPSSQTGVTIHVLSSEYLFHLCNSYRYTICRGNLPWVPWTVSYSPKNLRYDKFPLAANGWGTTHTLPGNGSTTQG